jgi:uncharacterized protein YijF (DUF1287 family)
VKKPGGQSPKYRPRGQPYEPLRRERRLPPRIAQSDGVSDGAWDEGPVETTPLSSPEPQHHNVQDRESGDAPRLPALRQWQPRESLMLPFVLAAVTIGLTQYWAARSPWPGTLRAPTAVSASATGEATDGLANAKASPLPTDIALVRVDAMKPLDMPPPTDVVAIVDQPSAPGAPFGWGPEISAREALYVPRARACSLSDVQVAKLQDPPPEPSAFGAALAAAAEAQTSDLVIYNDDYRGLRYPGGDVSPLYGVCSDVVIRAYRALGIDLQRHVHEARSGAGDISIDHRRTETLRRYFAKRAENLAVTDFAEDYLPGDIVTYDRPQNRHGNAHIAIVANQTGPSGRPMIVHNRGWGPQIEDALFVDDVTGHYRLNAPPTAKITDRGQPRRLGPGTNWLSLQLTRPASAKPKSRSPDQKTTPKL